MRSIITTIAYTVAGTMLVHVDCKYLGRPQCFGDMWAGRWAVSRPYELETIKLLHTKLTV